MNANCEQIRKHLRRIQGQLSALEGYVTEERSCEDISHLLKSITTSFASVRSSIVEEMLMRELDAGNLKSNGRKHVRDIVSVLQK